MSEENSKTTIEVNRNNNADLAYDGPIIEEVDTTESSDSNNENQNDSTDTKDTESTTEEGNTKDNQDTDEKTSTEEPSKDDEKDSSTENPTDKDTEQKPSGEEGSQEEPKTDNPSQGEEQNPDDKPSGGTTEDDPKEEITYPKTIGKVEIDMIPVIVFNNKYLHKGDKVLIVMQYDSDDDNEDHMAVEKGRLSSLDLEKNVLLLDKSLVMESKIIELPLDKIFRITYIENQPNFLYR